MKIHLQHHNIHIKAYCLLLSFSLFLFSCTKDPLEENPRAVIIEGFYNTAEEVETAVNAIYVPIREEMAEYHATLESHSDFMYGRGSWNPISLYQGLNDVNINRLMPFWDGFYVAIRNANLVIRYAPEGDEITQEAIDRYVAEAKFLRALCYFQLVRNWGSIPLRTVENMEEANIPKSPVDDVYNLILEDLFESEAHLPNAPAHQGRPSVWAAKTLLADVLLEIERYAEAAEKSQEVIQSGTYALTSVTSKEDFQENVFGAALSGSTEEVFYLKYARLEGQGNYILWISNHPNTGLFAVGGTGIGAYAVHGDASNGHYQSWNDNDIRKQLWDTIEFGLGPNTLVSSKFVDRGAVAMYGAGNSNPVYRYADLLLIYAEAAVRASGSVNAEAMEALNQVHRRAYGYAPGVPSEIDLLSSDYTESSFIDRVIQERGYEFVFEGKRWLELKRTGKAAELVEQAKGLSIAERHYLWPIPISEMNYNQALDPTADQNPGY